MDKEKFCKYIEEIIFKDDSMQEKSINDVNEKIKNLFSNRIFISNLKNARNNWLNIPVEEVTENILNFLESLSTISIGN